MVSKLRREVRGSRARSGPKESWQMRSQLMGERNGCANSVLSQTCGRGGVAGGVGVTSRRGCKGSTGRPSLQSQENGLQAFQRHVERRIEKLGVWTDVNASSEDHKRTSRGVFVAIDSNLGAVVGAEEGAIESIPGNEGRIAQAWVNVRGGLRIFWHSEGWTSRNEALLDAVLHG